VPGDRREKKKQVETEPNYTVQAKTRAGKCTRNVCSGGGGDEALGVRARRTSLPVGAALLFAKPARQSKRRVVLEGGLGMPDSRDWEAHVRWGLGTVSQRATPATETGRGRGGRRGDGGGEERGWGAQKAVMWVYSTHTLLARPSSSEGAL
jgi:hypothetical protein